MRSSRRIPAPIAPRHGSGSGCRTMALLLNSGLSHSPASGVEPQLGRAGSVRVQPGWKGSRKRGKERNETLMECLRNCQGWDWPHMSAASCKRLPQIHGCTHTSARRMHIQALLDVLIVLSFVLCGILSFFNIPSVLFLTLRWGKWLST